MALLSAYLTSSPERYHHIEWMPLLGQYRFYTWREWKARLN